MDYYYPMVMLMLLLLLHWEAHIITNAAKVAKQLQVKLHIYRCLCVVYKRRRVHFNFDASINLASLQMHLKILLPRLMFWQFR